MNELTKTLLFCVTAAVLAVAAMVVDPGTATPEAFSDQGEPLYPNFTDPLAPKAIEVIDYNEQTATARPLKVEFKNGAWRVPSHHGYPADAGDRLAKTAAALMELKKDVIVSDRVEDHSEYGVIDPLDQNATSLAGRGQRVTLRDENGDVLADFIVGKKVENKPGQRYIRIPGQNRTYAVQTQADVSARFEDWIETDLLKLPAGDIRQVRINSYSINERLGRLENVENLTLSKNEGKWTMKPGGKPDVTKVNDLTGALEKLKIIDVQPKPANLTKDLQTRQGIELSMESVMSLRQKGFFLTPTGQLLSNEGEIVVDAANGLQYTLRFGEIAGGGTSAGEEEASDAAGEDDAAGEEKKQKSDEGERRYLFITVNYSEARAKSYAGKDKEPDKKGKELADELTARFAGWYYVIQGADFTKLRPSSRQLRG